MRIRIRFSYPISYIPYKAIKKRTAWGQSEADFDIQEADAVDAPVVLRIGNTSGTNFARIEPGAPLRNVRRFRGKFYLEQEPADGLEDAVNNSEKTVFSDCVRRRTIETAEDIRKLLSQPLRKLDDDQGKSESERIASFVDHLLIIDGTVYRRCPEPVAKIDWDDRIIVEPRPRPVLLSGNESEFDGYQYDFGYPFINLRDVDAFLNSFCKDSICKKAGQWEIIDPSCLTFDWTAHNITKRAHDVMRAFLSGLNGLNKQALDIFYEFRDALNQAHSRATPDLVRSLQSMLTPQQANLEGDHASAVRVSVVNSDPVAAVAAARQNVARTELLSRIAAKAAEALIYWHARPDRGWEDHALPVSSIQTADPTYVCVEILSEGQIADACDAMALDPTTLLRERSQADKIFVLKSNRSVEAIARLAGDGPLETFGPQSTEIGKYVKRLIAANEAAKSAAIDVGPEQNWTLTP